MYQKQKILILLFLHLFFYEILFMEIFYRLCSLLWDWYEIFLWINEEKFTMVKFFSSQLLDDTCESVSRGRICWKSSFLLVLLIRFLPYFQISAKPIPSVQRLYSEEFMFALIEYFLLFTASCSLYRLSVPNLHIK